MIRVQIFDNYDEIEALCADRLVCPRAHDIDFAVDDLGLQACAFTLRVLVQFSLYLAHAVSSNVIDGDILLPRLSLVVHKK